MSKALTPILTFVAGGVLVFVGFRLWWPPRPAQNTNCPQKPGEVDICLLPAYSVGASAAATNNVVAPGSLLRWFDSVPFQIDFDTTDCFTTTNYPSSPNPSPNPPNPTQYQTTLTGHITNPAAGAGNEIGVCKYKLTLNPGTPSQTQIDPHIIIMR